MAYCSVHALSHTPFVSVTTGLGMNVPEDTLLNYECEHYCSYTGPPHTSLFNVVKLKTLIRDQILPKTYKEAYTSCPKLHLYLYMELLLLMLQKP